MSKALKSLWKIDHTICMNFNEKNIKWNIDNKDDPSLYKNGEGYDPEDTDCKSFDDFCECYEEIETALKDFEELKKGIEWRMAEYIKELDSGEDCDGIPLSETNRKIILNLYNIMCALKTYYKEDIKEHE